MLLRLAVLCACATPLVAQNPSAPTAASQPAAAAGSEAPAAIHGVIDLDGPWRFQIGDDPAWADPAFDDSKWQTVTLSQTLTDQGIDTYSGYAWYRLRLQPQQVAQFGNLRDNGPLALLLSSYSIGQLEVYVSGVESGHTRGLTDRPSMYLSLPIVAPLSQSSGSGPVVLAIRTWAGPSIPIRHGLLSRVELGSQDNIADRLALAFGRQWNQHVIAGMIVTLMFLFVAGLGATLYLSQRHHSEYLWLALMCLSVAFTGGIEAAYQQAA